MGLRYEAWTLPTAGTFERKIADIPVVEGTGTGTIAFSDAGQGSLTVPSDWSRLDELISTTEGSLVRVYDGDTLVHEWVAERVQHVAQDGGEVTISGPDVSGLLERAIVYPFDYPTQPTRFPDWIWGDDRDLLINSGFEGGTNLVDNPGFEDGTVDPWWAGAVDGVSATLAIESGTVDTGTYSAKCTPLLTEGGMSTSIRGFQPGKTYTVTARVLAGSGNSMQIGVGGPQSIGQGTATRILFIEASPSSSQYEAQKDFTGTGAWQTVTFNFVAGSDQTSGQLSIRDASVTPAAFYVDVVTITGYGVGMDPWQPSSTTLVTTFQSSTDVTADSGSYVGKVTAGDGSGMYQSVDDVIEGGTYTASIKVRNSTGSARWALELRDQLGTRLAQSSVATSTSWQTLTVTATLPTDLPGDRRQLQVWLVNYSGASATVYADTGSLAEGQAAATVGSILTDLLDDATTDHASDSRGTILTWLDYSGFDATNDSGSTAWASSISFIAYRGDTYLNVLRSLSQLGYEWRIVAKGTPSGGKTHNLEVYEPDGLGTDYSAAGTPAIVYGAGTVAGNIVKRVPNYTAVLAEGEDGVWAEQKDATAVTNFGRWERYSQFIESTGNITLGIQATQLLDFEADNRTAAQVRLVATPYHPRPLRDYLVGDTLQWQVPPLMTRNARKVQRITYTNTSPESFEVVGSSVFLGESGVLEAVSRLLQKFDPLRRKERARSSSPVTVSGSGGGQFTVSVAASNASALSKSKADYVCTGTDDQDVIQAANDSLTNGGLIQLSEGTFYLYPTVGTQAVQLGVGVSMAGTGWQNTILLQSSGSSSSTPLVRLGFYSTLRDLRVDADWGTGETAVWIANNGARIVRCRIEGDGVGVEIDGSTNGTYITESQIEANGAAIVIGASSSYTAILDCQIYSYSAASSAQCGIYGDGNNRYLFISGNYLYGGYYGIHLDDSSTGQYSAQNTITGNHFIGDGNNYGGIRLNSAQTGGNCWNTRIIGNFFGAIGGAATGTNATIELVGDTSSNDLTSPANAAAGPIISHNQIENQENGDGIRLDGIIGAVVTDNAITEVEFHGIRVDDSSHCDIAGNKIVWNTFASTAYDGVFLDGAASSNLIVRNSIYEDAGATARPWRYGINVAGTACADNVIVGNDLRYSGAGTAIVDSGTGTLLSWPNDATYGDNFT